MKHSPDAPEIDHLLRRTRRQKCRRLLEQVIGQRAQRREVVDDPDPAAVRGDHEVILARLYGDLASDPRVLRVVALSGGYSRDEACARLARDPTLIASFSRALLEGLTESQTDEQFNAQLESSIEQIYQASVHKQPASP